MTNRVSQQEFPRAKSFSRKLSSFIETRYLCILQKFNVLTSNARVIPRREGAEGSRAGRAVTEGNWRDRSCGRSLASLGVTVRTVFRITVDTECDEIQF